MSSKERALADTRIRILEAALKRVSRRNGADVTMAEIAQAAGVSRQAVYLHFADRTELLVSLAQYVDERRGLSAKLRAITEAPNGVAAALALLALQATDNPELWPIARAFEAVRRSDPAAERGWQDRLSNRLQGCRAIVARLEREGSLRRGLDPDAAADLLWTLTSLRMWEDLVVERGWSADRYRSYVGALIVGGLTGASPAAEAWGIA